ncbi:helix-turn-helix domain-containing protein [Corynebacterium guaraldiae]
MSTSTRTKASDFVNTAEACELLRCSPPTLRRYARANNWDRVRLSKRHVLFRRSQLEEFINKNTYCVH